MVSIVLVTYKRAHRLRHSIRDILNQTFRDFELIICDDCSPDETQAVCESFVEKDDRIRYFRHAANLQMPENLNFGIRHARYEYIAILHDGDRFRKDLIEQWYNAITKHPTVGFVFNTIGTTDRDNNVTEEIKFFEEGFVDRKTLLEHTYFRKSRLQSPVYGEVMVRRSLVERYGYIKPDYGFYADVDMWMEILHTHDAYYCADLLYTGPDKSIEPQQFTYHLIKVFRYLFEMHLKHRKRAFRGDPARLAKEVVLFYGYAYYYLTFMLLLTIKNFTLYNFMEAPAQLAKRKLLLLPWIACAIAYPILKPILAFFDLSKHVVRTVSQPLRGGWKDIMVAKASRTLLDFVPATALLAHDLTGGIAM